MLNRRGFLAVSGASVAVRMMPGAVTVLRERRVLTLVYDKALGALPAVERVVKY